MKTDFTRRGFLKAASLMVGSHMTVLRNGRGVHAILSALDPEANLLGLDNVFVARFAEEMRRGVYYLLSIKEMSGDRIDLFSRYDINFAAFSDLAAKLLTLPGPYRAVLFHRPEIKNIFLRAEQLGAPLINEANLMDDHDIVLKLEALWDMSLQQREIEKPVTDSGYEFPFYHGGQAPEWWHSCSQLQKLHVLMEARYIAAHGIPLDYFIHDDDRLVDLLKCNRRAWLPLDISDDMVNFLRPKAWFQAEFGPDLWRQRMLRSHELMMRSFGVPQNEARREAEKEVKDNKPPLVHVKKIADAEKRNDQSIYEVSLMGQQGADDLTNLLRVYDHIFSVLADRVHCGEALGENPWHIRFKDDRSFAIHADRDSEPLLNHLCVDCFSWDKAWLKVRPFALESQTGSCVIIEDDGDVEIETDDGMKIVAVGKRSYEYELGPIRKNEIEIWRELHFHL